MAEALQRAVEDGAGGYGLAADPVDLQALLLDDSLRNDNTSALVNLLLVFDLDIGEFLLGLRQTGARCRNASAPPPAKRAERGAPLTAHRTSERRVFLNRPMTLVLSPASVQ